MFKIEKNIPAPATAGNTGRNSKYPWHDMVVGDSFFVKDGCKNNLRNLCHVTSKRLSKKFVSSVYSDKKNEGVRIWRMY